MTRDVPDIRSGLKGLAGLPTQEPIRENPLKMALDPEVPQLSQAKAEKSLDVTQPLGTGHGNILSQAIGSLARELSTFGEELDQLRQQLAPNMRPAKGESLHGGIDKTARPGSDVRSKTVSDVELLISAVQLHRQQIHDMRTRLEL